MRSPEHMLRVTTIDTVSPRPTFTSFCTCDKKADKVQRQV